MGSASGRAWKLVLLAVCVAHVVCTAYGAVVTVDLGTRLLHGTNDEFEREKYLSIHEGGGDRALKFREWVDMVEGLNVQLGREVMQGPLLIRTFPNVKVMKAMGRRRIRRNLKVIGTRLYATANLVVTDHTKRLRPGTSPQKFARHAVRFFKYFFDERLPRPRYYEVLNEAFTVAAKTLPGRDEIVWQYLTELFDVTASTIHKEFGDKMKVGGYAAAWTEHEKNDFDVWKNRMKLFIDGAGKNIDFISQHLYDSVQKDGRHIRMSGSKMEAILDLVEQYSMLRWGRVIPHMISEYGHTSSLWQISTRPVWSKRQLKISAAPSTSRDWAIISSILNQMMQFMDRPDRIEKAVPFITGMSEWNWRRSKHRYPWVLYRRVKGKRKRKVFTNLVLPFRMLSRVQGKRLLTVSRDPNIAVHAFIDDRRVFILIKSMNRKSKMVVFKVRGAKGRLRKAGRQRLYLKKGRDRYAKRQGLERRGHPVLKKESSRGLPPIRLRPEEAVLIEAYLSAPVPPKHEARCNRYYANKTLVKIRGKRVEKFKFKGVQATGSGRAVVRIGVSRPSRLRRRPVVLRVNGVDVSRNIPDTLPGLPQSRKDNAYFHMIPVPVKLKLLRRGDNLVQVGYGRKGGRISSVILHVETVHDVNTRVIRLGSDVSMRTPNLVLNAGFENGLSKWKARGMTKTSPWHAWRGRSSARIARGYISQVLKVKPGQTYSLTARVRPHNGPAFVGVSGLKRRRGTSVNKYRSWSLVHVPFKVPKGKSKVSIFVASKRGNHFAFVDDVVVRSVRDGNSFDLSEVPEYVPRKGSMRVSIEYDTARKTLLIIKLTAASGAVRGRLVKVLRKGSRTAKLKLVYNVRALEPLVVYQLTCTMLQMRRPFVYDRQKVFVRSSV